MPRSATNRRPSISLQPAVCFGRDIPSAQAEEKKGDQHLPIRDSPLLLDQTTLLYVCLPGKVPSGGSRLHLTFGLRIRRIGTAVYIPAPIIVS